MKYEHKFVDTVTAAPHSMYLAKINREGEDGWEFAGETHSGDVVMKRCVGVSPAIDSAMRMLEADPHKWSTRPCATCKAVSTVLNRSFGCYATYK